MNRVIFIFSQKINYIVLRKLIGKTHEESPHLPFSMALRGSDGAGCSLADQGALPLVMNKNKQTLQASLQKKEKH